MAEEGGINSVHPDIIQTLILTKLDGESLMSARSACSHMQHLCSDDKLWRNICNSVWPSTADPLVEKAISRFTSGHRSFFSDSFPATHKPLIRTLTTMPSELISAVDIRFEDNLLYSKVVTTDTTSGWFMTSPFRIDLLGHKEAVQFDATQAQSMTLSWILIDPASNRALNLSTSRHPVSVRRHWLTGDLKVRYSTLMDGLQVHCGIVVTCEGKEGGDLLVKEVSMHVEDIDGKLLSGKDSLVILQAAMEGGRRKTRDGEEKEKYHKFLQLKKQSKERKQRKEKRIDMVCIASGITIFLSFWTLILFGSRTTPSFFS